MTLDDIMNQMQIEGKIEIRRWDNYNYPTILFKDDAWELNADADYISENISNMFTYNDGDSTILCFELEEE